MDAKTLNIRYSFYYMTLEEKKTGVNIFEKIAYQGSTIISFQPGETYSSLSKRIYTLLKNHQLTNDEDDPNQRKCLKCFFDTQDNFDVVQFEKKFIKVYLIANIATWESRVKSAKSMYQPPL